MFERKIVSPPLPQDLVTPTEHCRPCRGKGWEDPDPEKRRVEKYQEVPL